MHEISLARNILQTLESEFSEIELDKLLEINLKVGKLSNAEPSLLTSAFQAVTQGNSRYKNVKLNIDLDSVKVRCDVCNSIDEVENYIFKCKNGHPTNKVVQGLDIRIDTLRFTE